MALALEVAEKTIRLVREKIVVKTTQKIKCIDITPEMAEDLVNNIAGDIEGDEQLALLLSHYVAVDMPAVAMEILAEDIAERISTDIAADITQVVATWPDPSTKH